MPSYKKYDIPGKIKLDQDHFLFLKKRLKELELMYKLSPKLTKAQIRKLQYQFERIVNAK
ncbi:MAG: hypothetical protein AAGF07_01895 [Patescibacteria group bacterium]